jgi:hypothetical protein
MKISQLFAIPLLTTIVGITAFGFASPTKAQYLGDAHCRATVEAEPDSKVNVRSGPGTNFEVLWWSLSNGIHPRILNDRPNVGASPLRKKDSQGNDWYMVLRPLRGSGEPKLELGLIGASDRGWVRADFLRISCPP